MQAIGNALTIVGIMVTFVAYFGQHSGVSLADLEPGLMARWNKGRAWVRRRLGRTKHVTVQAEAAMVTSVAMSATGRVWSPNQPSDDIAVRADKLARNLDALRTNTQQMREQDRQRVAEVTQGLTERVNTLDQTVATRHEEDVQATTAAMRWEVRGLLITLVGAGLGIIG